MTISKSNVPRPEAPRWLMPTLVGVLLILVAAISFFVGRATAPTTAAPAPAPATTAPAGQATAEEQPPAEEENTPPQKAAPIEDAKTRELAMSLPRRQEGDPLALGPVDAPVVFSMWEDFACPMCTRFELDSFDQIRKYAEEGKIRIEWNDLSIFASNYHSDLGARGARAAARQGKFWEFVRAAYHSAGEGNHPTYDDGIVMNIAKEAGVPDLEKFKTDYNDPKIAEAVKADSDKAMQMGITGTPAFIVNDAFISGAYPTPYFINTIEDRLKAAKK
ncbi:hypothetical protein BSR29_07535 [Boudabousia liubingyangii]|uniref:Thioredoxin-like fold domain-containing protein n=1 Tax=Boudabousia liubingyangii TaxID=1921764 RepID=A0A1Q5PKA2_9ACTO|nr:thioredoxin domain-containing protein [Boudabousia liubingyangii]OKL46659.1 hypothetical protein BSR29_07535 [Boudabousia liubingyangii]OKL46754.1 hypothetical protein BSR28_04735 [Boudabousia liubingyangii]